MTRMLARRAIPEYVLCGLVLLTGCASNQPAADTLISASMQFSDYLKLLQPKHGAARVVFPLMEVYDEAGRKIYSDNDTSRNASVLRDLPGSLTHLMPVQGPLSMVDYLDHVPEFKPSKLRILQSHRKVVLSVLLDNCHACATQEAAIEETVAKGTSKPVQMLVVHVSQPS